MGKWVKSLLGAIGPITKGSGISRDQSHSGELPAVRYGEIYTHHNEYVKDYVSRISNEVAETAQPTHRGDILFAGSGETPDDIGKCVALLDDGVFAGGDLVIFSPPDGSDPVYWGCLLNIPYVQKQKAMRAQGSSIYHIRPDAIKKIEVVYNSDADDQRHIAEILTACDEVIEKSETVVEKYRAIKAGMLKDLFTRGIGKNGKLRPPPESAPQLYKDTALGKVPQEWEVKTIGEMFALKNGVSKGKEYFGHGVPIVNFTDVFNRPRITPDVLKGRVEMDRHELDSFAVKSGDVFFTRTSETPEEIGMAAVVIGEFVDTVFSGFVLRGRPISEDLENEFKVFCFRTDAVRKRIIGDCSYTTRALTNGGKLSAIKMGVPSTGEQRQIAERLSAIDAKIADELAVIAKYRKVKAGLMARLLTPPPDVEIVDGGG